MRVTGFALAIVVVVAGSDGSRAAANADETIRELIRLTDALHSGATHAGVKIDYLLVYARKAKPQVPAEQFLRLREDVLDELKQELWRPGELADDIAALWRQRFTDEEIARLVRFYASPLGQKLVHEQPGLTEAADKAARVWAVRMKDRIADRVRAELAKIE